MVEEGNTCISCGEDVCLFVQFHADVANLRRWHERAEALATNRERRKNTVEGITTERDRPRESEGRKSLEEHARTDKEERRRKQEGRMKE